VVWSERPFAYAFDDGRLRVTGREVVLGRAGSSLREGFRAASSRFFPASGRAPARELFTGPQYNTWIQTPTPPRRRASWPIRVNPWTMDYLPASS